MNSAITAILTDETTRSRQAVESLVAKSLSESTQPWLNEA